MISPTPLLEDSLPKLGTTYVSNASIQQLIWYAIDQELRYEYFFINKVEDLIAAISVNYERPTFVLCDCSQVKLPKGFAVYTGFNTTAFLCADNLSSAVDNRTIWEIDLSFLNGLYFATIKEAYHLCGLNDKEVFVKRFWKYPSQLYRYLTLLDPKPLEIEKDFLLSNKMLEALTDCISIQSYWIEMDKHTAMQLFAGQLGFLEYLGSDNKGYCKGLTPLLLPFVLAFRRTLNVEFIRAFGRWCLYSRKFWGSGYSLGVSLYKSFYFCNFSSLALTRWQEIVTDIEVTTTN